MQITDIGRSSSNKPLIFACTNNCEAGQRELGFLSEAAELVGCAGVKIRQVETRCLIRQASQECQPSAPPLDQMRVVSAVEAAGDRQSADQSQTARRRSLKPSIRGPDTEAQDLSPPNHHFRLATRGRSIQMCHKLPDFIAKCRRAGVKKAYIGLENINPTNLLAAKKKQNKITEYRRMLLEWQKAGILVYAGYIVGVPLDTAELVLNLRLSAARRPEK